jgi:hypothetical protein
VGRLSSREKGRNVTVLLCKMLRVFSLFLLFFFFFCILKGENGQRDEETLLREVHLTPKRVGGSEARDP